MKSRKRTLALSQPDAPSTRKVRVVPIYRAGQKKSSTTLSKKSDTGMLLSLPATLGRRNLAECWWKHCPFKCNAALPESTPCRKVCFAVRRKSHREAISKSMLEIDAQGRVRITARNKQLVALRDEQGRKLTRRIDWTSSVRHHLKIGNLAERDTWMEFYIEPAQIVTPDHEAVWLEATRKNSSTKRCRRFPPFSLSDSPSRRQLFFEEEEDEDDGDDDSSSSSSSESSIHHEIKQCGTVVRKKNAQEGRNHARMDAIDNSSTKAGATSRKELSKPNKRDPQNRDAFETQPPLAPQIGARRLIAKATHDTQNDTMRENRSNIKASLGDGTGAKNKHRPHRNDLMMRTSAGHQDESTSSPKSQQVTHGHDAVWKKEEQEHRSTTDARKTAGSEERSCTLFQSTQAPSILASFSEDLFSECQESKAGKKGGLSVSQAEPSVPLRQPSFDDQSSTSSSSRRHRQEESAVLSLPLDNEDETSSSEYLLPVHRSTHCTSTRTGSLAASGSHDEATRARAATCNSSQYYTWTLQDWKRYSESEPGSKFKRAITTLVLANNHRGDCKSGRNLRLPSLLGREE